MELLQEAIGNNDADAVAQLVSGGAAVDLGVSGTPPLHVAARDGKENALGSLIRHDANVEARDKQSRTAILWAARNGHLSCVQQLIAAHADVNACDDRQKSAAYTAAASNHVACLEVLIAAGAQVNVKSTSGANCAWVAANYAADEALTVLIRAGADITTPNNAGDTPLQAAHAARNGTSAALLAIATGEWGEHETRATELLAAAREAVLVTALPRLFVQQPRDGFAMAVTLAASFRKHARQLLGTDAKGAEQLIEAAVTVQQVLVGLLDCLDRSELTELVLSEGGMELLASAARAECKEVLAYKRVQSLLHDRWRLVHASDVSNFATLQYFGQETGNGKERLVQAPSRTSVFAEAMLAYAYNALLLVPAAAYPPLEAWVGRRRDEQMGAARAHVQARNAPPTEWTGDEKVLRVDGVNITTIYRRDPPEVERSKRDKHLDALTAVVEDEALLELRHWPLFQPEGKFWLHILSQLTLTSLLTATGALDVWANAGLTLWCAQLSVLEMARLLRQPSLYLSDAFSILELMGALFATASLVISLCSVTLEGTTTSEPLHAKPTDESDAYTAELALRALAVAALWISQSFRVLGRSVTFGPLTFMFLKMTEDVFRFVVLMGGVVLGAAPHTS